MNINQGLFSADNWTYGVATLGCHIVPLHTGRAVADNVQDVLKDFVPQPGGKYQLAAQPGGHAQVVDGENEKCKEKRLQTPVFSHIHCFVVLQ
jgi:hypothetical protein